jgi:hypothetical protein
MSLMIKSIQPLVVGVGISLVANVIGQIASRILLECGCLNSRDYPGIALGISMLTNIGLSAAGIVAGITPGGLLGVAMIAASVAVTILIVLLFDDKCLDRHFVQV